jgi:heme-degrading monooxygenase HmoA
VGLLPMLEATEYTGLYDVEHDDGVSGTAGITLINPFDVQTGPEEQFLKGWYAARETLANADGYIATRLYRAAMPNVRFAFVNIARWRDAGAFKAAVGSLSFPPTAQPHPGLYEIVRS